MRRSLSFLLAIMLSLLMPWPILAEERPVLTIGDVRDRSSKRVDGENQLGVWRYLEDLLDSESDTMASDSATDSPAPAAIFSVGIITVNWVTHPSTTRTIT